MKRIILSVLTVSLFFSCKEEEPFQIQEPNSNEVWNLIHYREGDPSSFNFVSYDYYEGSKVFDFDNFYELNSINKVEIKLNSTMDYPDILPYHIESDFYNYSMTESNISIEGESFLYFFEGDDMYLFEGDFSDGKVLHFVKEE